METRQFYIDRILFLQDDIRQLAEKYYDYYSVNEYESVNGDINDYQDDDFRCFKNRKELKEYIEYLEGLIKVGRKDE